MALHVEPSPARGKMQFGVDPQRAMAPMARHPCPWANGMVWPTFNQGEVQFYLNGEADGTATLATTSLYVSRSHPDRKRQRQYFRGDIDEVGMWSRHERDRNQALQLDSESALTRPSGCELFSIQTRRTEPHSLGLDWTLNAA